MAQRKKKAAKKRAAKKKAGAKRAARTRKTAQALALGEVPIGTILDYWYHPRVGDPPLEYEYCDGRIVRHPSSRLRGQRTPDLRNLFVRGAATQRPAPYQAPGGRDTHDHTVDLPAHAHRVSVPGHNHVAASVKKEGARSKWRDGMNAVVMDWGNGVDAAGSGYYPLATKGRGAKTVRTDQHPQKTYTSALGGATTKRTTAGENLPRHARLVKIMRVV